MRPSGRAPDQLRDVTLEIGVSRYAEGSCLARFGQTHVLCTASVEQGVPGWLKGQGRGWVTGEYGMLPRATHTRGRREAAQGKQSGRTQEIQRLIGRSLRSVVDLKALGDRTITLDCDVIQADGGTRTAAITGAFVALCDALAEGRRRGLWGDDVLLQSVAAVSAGVVDGRMLLDLDYREDVTAAVDCNLVMTDRGEWVEIQATGERSTLTDAQLAEMLAIGRRGIERLFALQQEALNRPLGA